MSFLNEIFFEVDVESILSLGLIKFIVSGGIFMVPLILCSFAAVTIIIYLFLSVKRENIIPNELEDEVKLIVSNPDKLQDEPYFNGFLGRIKNQSSILAKLVEHLMEGNFYTRKEALDSVQINAHQKIISLDAPITWLDVIITISPLLGLLGTASGLVNIFAELSVSSFDGGTSSPAKIAIGISEALNTTIVGLAITVPCVIAHGHFSKKMESYAARLESIMSSAVTPFTCLYDDNFWMNGANSDSQNNNA